MVLSPHDAASSERLIPGEENGALRVFISYSRKDNLIADKLLEEIRAAGFTAWKDEHDIAAGEPWKVRILQLINAADSIVFVVSPDAMASPECRWEIEEADRLGKRIFPVIARTVPDDSVPRRLRRLNYVYLTDKHVFEREFRKLREALTRDVEWIRHHTRIGEYAHLWMQHGRNDDRLLRGKALIEAEVWLAMRRPKHVETNDAQREFVQASRAAEVAAEELRRTQLEKIQIAQDARARFQRRSAVALGIIAVLVVFGLIAAVYQKIDSTEREARVFTSLAAQAATEGNYDRQMRFALQALPAPGELPFIRWPREAEAKLRGAIALNRLHQVLKLDQIRVLTAAYSPDGRRIVTGGWNENEVPQPTARIWNADTGNMLYLLPESSSPAYAVAFSPDGKYVSAAFGDGTTGIWRSSDGKLITPLPRQRGPLWTLAWSRDGNFLSVGGQSGIVTVWDVKENMQARTFAHSSAVRKVCFSPDGSRLAVGYADGQARVWHLNGGMGYVLFDLHMKGKALTDVSFHLDGRRILTTSEDGTGYVWDAFTGKEHARLTTPSQPKESLSKGPPIQSGTFGPDGSRILTTARDGTAALWNAETGYQVFNLQGHKESVLSGAFSSDGTRIVTASWDRTVRIWNTSSGRQESALIGHEGPVHQAVFSPDGKHVLSASDDSFARIWHAGPIAPPVVDKGDQTAISDVRFSANGNHIVVATSDGVAEVWQLSPFILKGKVTHTSRVSTAVLNREATLVLTTSTDAVARLWDVTTGTILQVYPHARRVRSAEFSPDEQSVVTASDDATIKIWKRDNSEPPRLLGVHKNEVVNATFSPDGKTVLSASWDWTAILWDIARKKSIRTFPHRAPLRWAAFAPDGMHIVTSASDNHAYIWDVWTKAEPTVLRGHRETVRGVSFSPDSRRVATSSHDGTVRLYEINGTEIAVLNTHTDTVWNAVFNVKGDAILTASSDGRASLWDISKAVQGDGPGIRKQACDGLSPKGAQEFTAFERQIPILRGIAEINPCQRFGVTSADYWKNEIANLIRKNE